MDLLRDPNVSTAQAILRGLCPRCRRGRIFPGAIFAGRALMNERCPVCGLKFEREQGYFLGAMYISYGLMLPLLLFFLFLLWALTGWAWWLRFTVAVALLLPLAPFLARLARILWIHFDRAVDPVS